jgi:heme/copper-type cytochrome/quinol oxidase subunit 3
MLSRIYSHPRISEETILMKKLKNHLFQFILFLVSTFLIFISFVATFVTFLSAHMNEVKKAISKL